MFHYFSILIIMFSVYCLAPIFTFLSYILKEFLGFSNSLLSTHPIPPYCPVLQSVSPSLSQKRHLLVVSNTLLSTSVFVLSHINKYVLLPVTTVPHDLFLQCQPFVAIGCKILITKFLSNLVVLLLYGICHQYYHSNKHFHLCFSAVLPIPYKRSVLCSPLCDLLLLCNVVPPT